MEVMPLSATAELSSPMVNSSDDAHDCVHAHPEIRAGAKDTLLKHAKHQMQHIAGLALTAL